MSLRGAAATPSLMAAAQPQTADAAAAPRASEPATAGAPRGKLANLRIIWRFVARYRLQVLAAILSLLVAAGATLAIPSAFRLIIDRGFSASAGGAAAASAVWGGAAAMREGVAAAPRTLNSGSGAT